MLREDHERWLRGEGPPVLRLYGGGAVINIATREGEDALTKALMGQL